METRIQCPRRHPLTLQPTRLWRRVRVAVEANSVRVCRVRESNPAGRLIKLLGTGIGNIAQIEMICYTQVSKEVKMSEQKKNNTVSVYAPSSIRQSPRNC